MSSELLRRYDALAYRIEDYIGTVYALLPLWLDYNHPDRDDVAQEALLNLMTTERDLEKIGTRRLIEYAIRDAIRTVIPDMHVEPLSVDQDGMRTPVEVKGESDAERMLRRDRERQQKRMAILTTGSAVSELPDNVPGYRLHPLYRLVCLFCG